MEIYLDSQLYTCRYCEKQFAGHDSLAIHMKMHIKDPPYKCQYCDKNFHSNALLNRHIITHRDKTI